MPSRQLCVVRELMIRQILSIDVHDLVLAAAGLVVGPSALVQRSSLDDYSLAALRQRGDVSVRSVDPASRRSAADTGHTARRCWPADNCLGFADDNSAMESAIK
jgi:hypothetical protein